MVLNRALGWAGDKYKVGNPGREGLFDGILDDRLVDDRQQFFRHCLGGWQKPRPQSGYRKYCFSNFLHVFFGRVFSSVHLSVRYRGLRP